MKHELLIIIPAYNEEESIGAFLSSLLDSSIPDIADVVVINDASTDQTVSIVRSLGIPVISHPYNLGYGTALQTGYKYACDHHYHYLIQMDGDGQHDICNIKRIYQCLLDQDAPDIVIGSRFFKESKSFAISFAKKIAIRFFQKAIYMASKQHVTDPTSGLQGLKESAFSYYAQFGNFDNNYPDANMIIQMALLGFHIKEIPAVMHERQAGQSMHFGIIEPFLYMCIMLFSTSNVFIRGKKHLLAKPAFQKGDFKHEKK